MTWRERENHNRISLHRITVNTEGLAFQLFRTEDLERHLWAASLHWRRKRASKPNSRVQCNATVYHYLRHLSRTGTRVYTKRRRLHRIFRYLRRINLETLCFSRGENHPKVRIQTLPSAFVGSAAHFQSKWPVSARSRWLHSNPSHCIRIVRAEDPRRSACRLIWRASCTILHATAEYRYHIDRDRVEMSGCSYFAFSIFIFAFLICFFFFCKFISIDVTIVINNLIEFTSCEIL